MTKLNSKNDLNEPQMKAVTSIDGPVLIIAGAGSGKTRVITYRIARMLDKGIPQSAVLALTFTNKAAREMETRVKELTGKKLQSLTLSTFHSFGLKIIRENCELIGYKSNFSVYDETDKMSLIKESLRECKMFTYKADLYALSQLFSKIKTGLAQWTEDITMRPVYEEYQQMLKTYNSVDFDDLLVIPLELLKNHSDVLSKYRQKYRYILVDEFQDTSLIQYKILKLLAVGKNGDSCQSANICVVGDDDQSIYSWRGANYENLLMFEKDFPSRMEIKLEQNYRSTSAILNAANGLISHNAGRKKKKLWAEKEGGKPVELSYPENETEESDFIANQIRYLMISERRKYHDFGVLTRTNSLARNIEESFLSQNIPYRVSGGTSFFQRKEIKDIISYLRVIANTDDDVSLLRIINTPRRGIGKTTISALNEISRKNRISVWNAVSRLNHKKEQGLFQDQRSANDLDDFTSLLSGYQSLILERKNEGGKPWKLSRCVKNLIDEINYWGYLVAEHGKDEKKAKWKNSNIEYFIRMIENWENDPDNLDTGLYAWLNRISLITRDDGEDDNEGKVSLMTIHAAKGLEFPVVFIAGAEQGLIPHEKSIRDENEENEEEAGSIEEERRLFYVAITRAREKLFITSCRKRRYLQSAKDCSPSQFLEEIPKELLNIHVKEDDTADDKQAKDYIAQMRAILNRN